MQQQQQRQHRRTSAMHQFAKPRHNKLSSVSSSATQEPQSFFSKLAVWGNSSAPGSSSSSSGSGTGTGRRISVDLIEVVQNGASMYTPSEWAFRGVDWENDDLQDPQIAPRPPSLTHSRASSSDSAASTSTRNSSLASVEYKPLPALPEVPKARRASLAVLEAIDEQSSLGPHRNSLALSRHASQDGSVRLSIADFSSLHAPHTSTPPCPSPSTESTCTPRRPASAYTFLTQSSPRTVWTPRDSTCYTPALPGEEDSSSSPFGLEASLARQEALEAAALNAQAQAKSPLSNIVEEGVISGPSSPLEHRKPSFALSLNLDLAASEGGCVSQQEHLDGSVDEEEATYIVQEEDEEPLELPASVEPTPRRATIRKRTSMRLSGSGSFVNGGWRGWRSVSSQPSTPSGEVPPQLALQPPTAGISGIPEEVDYFGAAMASRLASIVEASPSPSPSTGMLRLGSSTRSGSPLPKLSPEFTFGSRAASPVPSFTSAAEPSQGDESVRPQRKVRESLVPMAGPAAGRQPEAGRRSRASSTDHGRTSVLAEPVQPNPVAASKAGSSSSVSHRNRLALRKFAGNAPRFQVRSFDAEELKLLREMTAPKYSWI